MASPFPGMNPYLEHPEMWPEVHHMLISILAETLTPQLLPKYRAAIDKRVYYVNSEDSLLVGIPDVTVDERLHQGIDTQCTGRPQFHLPRRLSRYKFPCQSRFVKAI